jgi:2-aminoadipate transaminase
MQYAVAPGYPPLREWLAGEYGVASQQVFLGNSSLELLSFLTHILLGAGKRAFVESPSYDRANVLLQRSGAQVVPIPLQLDGVDLDIFEGELKRGAPGLFYIIADFQNPMGTTTSLEKRRQLAAWAREYDFWIVEDAPYRRLRYSGEALPSLHALAPDRVIHMASLSKILAPGLRMGYLVAETGIVQRLTEWAIDTYIGPVTPTQGMAYTYLRAGKLSGNIEKLCNLYRPRLEALLAALDRDLPQTRYPRPQGGFFIGVQLPEGVRMDWLLPRAEQAGIKLSDGRGFFVYPADGERFVRIPFCSLTVAEIEAAVAGLAQVVGGKEE